MSTIAAWFVAVTLANGDVKIVNQPYASLYECMAFEVTITQDYQSTKCFYGLVPRALPARS